MLRALVLVLILANAGFFAWRHGWLGDALGNTETGRDPQRMKAQVHPERLVVQPPPGQPARATGTSGTPATEAGDDTAPSAAASTPASAAASAPLTAPGTGDAPPSTTASALNTKAAICMEAGPFTQAEQRQVTPQLAQLPTGSWTSQTVAVQGLWLVYMGPYGDPDSLERKQIELRRIRGLNFEEVRSPANLAMGLSLGRYNQETQAQAALETLRARGIRTARVVTVRPAMDLSVVRVPQAGLAVQRVLTGMTLPSGKGFGACKG